MLTDTHCHFEDERYENMEQVIADNLPELAFAIDVCAEEKNFEIVSGLSQRYDKIYASLGVHPHFALRTKPDEISVKINSLIRANKRIVAVGECGLDYNFREQDLEGRTEYEYKEAQRKLFEAQIDIAKNNNLPLVLHIRDGLNEKDAYEDALQVLEEKGANRGTVHTFASDLSTAQRFLSHGFFLGISGLVTFDKTGKLAQVIKEVALEKLLLETDAPWLAPVPHRGKLNQPKYTQFIAEKIAEIKDVAVETVLEQTEKNARELFKI